MDWREVQYLTTVIGAAVGIVNIVAVVQQHRARRFFDRSIRLFDLRGRLAALGPLEGPTASSVSAAAHDEMLRECEREARANAALFVSTGATLKKPGSYVWGGLSLAYALLMAVVTGNLLVNLSGQHFLAAAINAVVPGLVTFVLLWTGSRALLRRDRARTLRRQIGEVDPVSIEGIARSVELRLIRRAIAWVRRWLASSQGPTDRDEAHALSESRS